MSLNQRLKNTPNQSEWLENALKEVEKPVETSFVLQNPNLQDRNSKRAREGGSYSAQTTTKTKFKLMYRKKPKLNPVVEQEEIVKKIEVIDTNTMVKENSPPVVLEETH